jgi:hypothetical protein
VAQAMRSRPKDLLRTRAARRKSIRSFGYVRASIARAKKILRCTSIAATRISTGAQDDKPRLLQMLGPAEVGRETPLKSLPGRCSSLRQWRTVTTHARVLRDDDLHEADHHDSRRWRVCGAAGCTGGRPGFGDLITGSRGLRKIRWNEHRRQKGKRGGVRVIYYWYGPGEVIYMLLAYSKGERDDLTAAEKRVLKQLVAEEFR